jgi:hypothetical protein
VIQQQSISPRNASRSTRILHTSVIYVILAITLIKPERVFDRCRTAGTCVTRYFDGRARGPWPET